MARRGRASSRAPTTTTPSASSSSLESSPLASYAAPSSSSSSSRTWTPLRDNYFQPPPLSARERAYLVRKSCEAAQELVERARSAGGPITWRHVEKHNDVQVYAGSLRSTAGAAASMCAVTSVPGTVHEVASLFELGSTRHMKEFARAHREWFYDGVVLHVMAPRTKEKPLHQVTAKWMVAQMPPGLPHRDFCFLECQDKFVDARGRKGWVLGQHSIKLPGCDDLKREFGLVRGSLYHSGFVVVESEERPGHVDVIHLVQLNLKEHTPVPLSLLRARVLFVTQVRNMLRSKRLNEQRYRSDLELVPKKYRSKCGVCKDSFSLLLLRKMNCRKCGEVVCAACSKEFSIENSNFAATNGGDEVRKLRICMHCFQAITTAPKPTSALVQPAHSSTMSISFLGVNDAGQHAASRVGGRSNDREDELPKIFLQSMHREKPSRQRMSSTLHMSGFRSDLPQSASRHRTRGEPDMEMYSRSQHQQQRDYGRSHNHRESQRLRPSDFRPSQSLSLDDPITRGGDRYTMDVPGLTAAPSFSSIFDRPSTDASQSPCYELTSSSSSDLLVELSSNDTGNFSRLQELSSRERLERLQREDNMARSGNDHRMPDAYMSALEQASRDKHELDMPTPVYQPPPNDFCAYRGTFDDKLVPPPDFGPYESTLNDFDGPSLLDVNALNTTESAIPIDLASIRSPTRSPTTSQRGERDYLRPRERKSERYRESTSSDSSAISIDIDTYEGVPHVATIPSIPEQRQRSKQYGRDGFAGKMKSNAAAGPILYLSRGNGIEPAHDSDEDSDTSMGASDDEEEGQTNVNLTPAPPRWSVDDNAAETKVQDFSGTLAFPPPSPPAYGVNCTSPERQAAVNSSAYRQLEDHTSADTRKTRGVENVSQTNTEAVNDTSIGDEYQLQRSKVEDLNDREVHQVRVSSKRSEIQIAGEDERIDGLCDQAIEGVLVSCKRRLPDSENALDLNMVGGDVNADVHQLNEDCGGVTGFYETSSSSSRLADSSLPAPLTTFDALSAADGALPPYEGTPTSFENESGETPASSEDSHAMTRGEDTVALDSVESEAHHVSLNSRNGSADWHSPKELNDVSSVTSESTFRTVDDFATGVNVALIAVEDVEGDLVTAGVNKLSVHDEPLVISPEALTSVSPSSEVQKSGDIVSETGLRVVSRSSFSSLSDANAQDSIISGLDLDPIAPPHALYSASTDRLLDTSASLSIAQDSESHVGVNGNATTVSLIRGDHVPPVSSDCIQTTEELDILDYEVLARDDTCHHDDIKHVEAGQRL